MKKEEFERIFIEECKKNSISLDIEKIEIFYQYMIQILEWNEKINLTAITDEKEFIIKHFIDSLTISKLINNGDKIIDIGTGAGFPGIPLKIVNSNSEVTLIDSVNKKLNVIRDITTNLQFDKLNIIHTRAEDLAIDKNYREKFDVATTRAVSNLSTIAEYMLPFIKVGGKAICMKGPNFEEELSQSKKAISILGGRIEKVESLFVSGEFERNLIIIEKIKNTPKNYPRGKGKALKEPIS